MGLKVEPRLLGGPTKTYRCLDKAVDFMEIVIACFPGCILRESSALAAERSSIQLVDLDTVGRRSELAINPCQHALYATTARPPADLSRIVLVLRASLADDVVNEVCRVIWQIMKVVEGKMQFRHKTESRKCHCPCDFCEPDVRSQEISASTARSARCSFADQ